MSYATARARIIALVEGITPTDPRVPGKFRHVAEGRAGQNLKSRSFWLEAAVDGDAVVDGPYTPNLSGQPRFRVPLTLTVTYRDMTDRAVLDEVLAADFKDLATTLLVPANWNTTTSGVHSLTNAATYLPTRRVYGDGTVEQRSFLSLWHS